MEVDVMTSLRLREHNELRRYLDGQIPRKELKNLKDSLRTLRMLEPKFLDDHAKDFSDVFHKLDDENIISVGKYGPLIMLFQCNRLLALAEYVQKKQDNFPPPSPLPSYDVPKSFEETQGKTNIHGQETKKPDPDMGPGSGMDVRGHEEIEYGAACHSTHKDLSEPDATDHGEGGSGNYGRDRSLDAAYSGEVPEPQQQIIQPAHLLPNQEPGPGSGMDVRGHEEIEYGAACHSTRKDLSEPDATDHGEGGSGYYGRDRSSDAADSCEVPEPQQQIIQPTRFLQNQEPKDTSCEKEMMQCDSDPQKEGMRSEFFDAANQPPVTEREITEATDGVSHMQIDPPDMPETDPIAEPFADGTRGGIAPPSYGSMYPNPGGAPQKHQRVVPGLSPVTKPPPSEPEPTGQTAPIVQYADIGGVGNMGNFFVGGEMTVSSTTTSYEGYPLPQTNPPKQKGKGPAGTSQTFEGEPLKKVPVHTVKKETKQKAGPLQGASARGELVVRQTSNIRGIGNFGNVYCGGNMTVNKTTHTYKKQ